MINEMLEERKLPSLLVMNDGRAVTRDIFAERRAEMLAILSDKVYGKMPASLGETTWEEVSCESNIRGLAQTRKINISFPTPYGESFTFPVSVTIPNSASADNKLPALVFISFGYLKYYPIEEILEQNVIVAEIQISDIAPDSSQDEFKEKMSRHYFTDGQREPDSFGKIGMWAYAASRVLDYLLSLDCVDADRVGVMGHSRLGKTALWAGANDERFTHIFSNDSGCCGAAITRGKEGEKIPRIYLKFSYWFCKNFSEISSSVEDSESTYFDQHFLLACCAPRKLYVASAAEDTWADPVSEYLCCVAASPAWELFGIDGFVHPDNLPEAWDRFADGNIGYHLRPDGHFLSRHDWMRFIDFLKK